MTTLARRPKPLLLRPRRLRSTALRWYATAIAGGLCAALLAPVVAGGTTNQFFTAIILLTLAVVIGVADDWRRNADKLSVLTLIGAFYALAFVGGSIYVWAGASLGIPVPVHQAFGHAALVRAEWLCLISWVALVAGYRFRLFSVLRIRPLKLQAQSDGAHAAAMVVLFLVGWVARIAGVSRGLYFHPVLTSGVAAASSVNQALAIAGVLPSIAVAYLGIRAHTRPQWRWYYRGLLLSELGFALPSGNRVDAVTVLILALVVAYYTTRGMPVKAIIFSSIFGLFFVFPVLIIYRTSNQDKGYQVSDLSTGIATYTSGGLGNTLLYGVGSTLKRFSDINLPAALEERGRKTDPIADGTTIGWIFTNYIPQVLDPHKRSLITYDDQLAYSLRVTPVLNSSYATTPVGELYLDFGTVGMFFAMIVLGAVFREMNEWLALRNTNPMVLAVYAAFAYQIVRTQEPLLALGLGGLIRDLIVAAILIRGMSWLFERSDSGAVPGVTSVGDQAA